MKKAAPYLLLAAALMLLLAIGFTVWFRQNVALSDDGMLGISASRVREELNLITAPEFSQIGEPVTEGGIRYFWMYNGEAAVLVSFRAAPDWGENVHFFSHMSEAYEPYPDIFKETEGSFLSFLIANPACRTLVIQPQSDSEIRIPIDSHPFLYRHPMSEGSYMVQFLDAEGKSLLP